jgi:thiol-disulfide isomerase/thioredoxin
MNREWNRRAAYLTGLSWTLCALLLSGCTEKPTAKPGSAPGSAAQSEPAKKSPAPSPAPAPAAKSSITLVDPAGLAAEVAKHQGKIVLVDFWSTTCIPCLHGVPKMAELHRKYAGKGFVVLSLAMDDKQDDESDDAFRNRLLSALGPSQAEFTNLLSKPGGSEEAMLAFEIDGGSLPHYRLFARDGKLIKKFVMGDPDNVWDHTDVVAAVEGALK